MAGDEHLDEPGPDLTGAVLDGRYRVTSALGRGGMGSVYLAEDLRFTGRNVVVKVPHPELLAIPGFRKRFGRELESLVRLEHLHIVKVLDSGVQDGSPYAVLQYLAGGSLEQRIEGAGGRMPLAEILKWLFPVADTLDFIHREGWMHRDIKPANILFDRQGNVFLADFGIAKALDAAGPQLTQTGRIPGSPLYMAPEVLSSDQPVGPAYDQYSLGVVIYQILSGELPHMGATPFALMTQKVLAPPSPLQALAPQIPPRAVAAVMRAISSEPRERFASCLEFAQEFERGLKEAPAASEAEPKPASDAVTKAATKSVTNYDTDAGTEPATKAVTRPATDAVTRPATDAVTRPATDAVTTTMPVQAAPPSRRGLWAALAVLLLFGAGLGAAYLAGIFPRGTSTQGPGPQPTQALAVPDPLQPAQEPAAPVPPQPAREPAAPVPPQPAREPAAPVPPQPAQEPVGEGELEAFRKSCEAGDVDGCFELAVLYAEGSGVAQDQGKAVELYRKACDGGLFAACSSLGFMYENGEGVAQDYFKAAELHRKACDQEDAASCSNLGGLYDLGLGVGQNPARAVELYRKACDGGNSDGCGNLAGLYEAGRGVQEDPARAAELYRQACKSGGAWSCDQLRRLGLAP